MRIITLGAFLLPLTIGLASAAPGGDGERHERRGPPPLDRIVEQRADELGISDEAVSNIQELAQAERTTMRELRDELRNAHESLRAAMQAEPVDEAAVFDASNAIGNAEKTLRDHRVAMGLAIRDHLTAEQFAALAPERPPRGPHRARGNRGECRDK
ncbi:MAG: periplasmic heavy metal sensor [Myxococcales bacterium]|nr:periplasmic heavy metal sensor [Myxococcales bacterium]